MPDSQKVIAEEMEAFCEKKAAEYGFTRGENLAGLQLAIADESYYYEETAMKNEEAVDFLEKEREEIASRRDAVFDRIKHLPIGG